jgi:hypothetical protein
MAVFFHFVLFKTLVKLMWKNFNFILSKKFKEKLFNY